MEVRPNCPNQRADIVFLEDGDGVHVRQGSQNLSALACRHQRTPFAFEDADRIVGVDGYNQPAAESFGCMQVTYVSDVEHIEASIGEGDLLTGSSPGLNLCFELFA
jgi:hypothetical protein